MKAKRVTKDEHAALLRIEEGRKKLLLKLEILNHDGAAMLGRLMEKYGSFHGVDGKTGDIVREAPKAPKP